MIIRTADIMDLDDIAAIEAACFPPAEAAARDEFKERLTYYGRTGSDLKTDSGIGDRGCL